uniref:Uncharacterized protein n=1 Tax=Sinocyclocheilus anshuiensis TaxID=1608454 RepID=A0A671NQU3_9TELE
MSNNRFCSPSFSAVLYINTEPATLSYSSTCFQTREKETERGIHSDPDQTWICTGHLQSRKKNSLLTTKANKRAEKTNGGIKSSLKT